MSKHTPGPWFLRSQGDANEWCILTPDKKTWVLGLRHNAEPLPETQIANLRLCAVEPELLDVLKKIVAASDKGAPLLALTVEASQIIAKAEGRE